MQGRARPASRSLAEHRLHNLDVENNPGRPKQEWLRVIVKTWPCRGHRHTLWRWGSRPLGPNLGDVSLIFDINHKTESAVQSSWMNARVSAELLSGVGAGGGGEAHRTGDSGGLDAQK